MNIKTEAKRLAGIAQKKVRGYTNTIAEKLDDLVTTEAERRTEKALKDQADALVRLEKDNTALRKAVATAEQDNKQLRQRCRVLEGRESAAVKARSFAVGMAWVGWVTALTALAYIVWYA